MTFLYWMETVLGLEGGNWGAFWSGFGSGPVAWCALPIGYYWHHVCHENGCFWPGHPDSEGKVWCRKHSHSRTASGD